MNPITIEDMDLRLAQRVDEISRRIARLQEPYRSNTIAWLERTTDVHIQRVDRDLPRVVAGMRPSMRRMCVQMLEDLLDEALRYFDSGRPAP